MSPTSSNSTKSAKRGRDVTSELIYLPKALKAPALRDAAGRLAERARSEEWSHEEYLAACRSGRLPPVTVTEPRAVSGLPASPPASRSRSLITPPRRRVRRTLRPAGFRTGGGCP